MASFLFKVVWNLLGDIWISHWKNVIFPENSKLLSISPRNFTNFKDLKCISGECISYISSNTEAIGVKSILSDSSVWNSPKELWEHMRKTYLLSPIFFNLNPSSMDSRWSLSIWDGLGNGLWVQVVTVNWNHSNHRVIPCSYISLKFNLWKSQ